ncbi:MAG: alpha/beta hydrolase [Actinomycetes bacterium]
MSTPPFLDLPAGVRDEPVGTGRGTFAALRSGPDLDDEQGDGHGEAHPDGHSDGPSDRHRVVVLVPGFTGSKEDFIAVLAPIGAAGFPVVAYDQRGQHGTAALTPQAPPEGWELDAFAADLLAVVDRVAGPRPTAVHLLGHSFGGLVARAAVLRDPARFSSLVLLDSGPASIGPERDARLIALADALPTLGLAPVWQIMQALELEAGNHPPGDPEVAEFLERRLQAHDPL